MLLIQLTALETPQKYFSDNLQFYNLFGGRAHGERIKKARITSSFPYKLIHLKLVFQGPFCSEREDLNHSLWRLLGRPIERFNKKALSFFAKAEKLGFKVSDGHQKIKVSIGHQLTDHLLPFNVFQDLFQTCKKRFSIRWLLFKKNSGTLVKIMKQGFLRAI